MTKAYEIEVEGGGYGENGIEVMMTHYKRDDGHFVGSTPTTFQEIQVIGGCKSLVKLISPYAKLKITIEEIK